MRARVRTAIDVAGARTSTRARLAGWAPLVVVARPAGAALVTLVAALGIEPATAQRFYPDDPIWREPPPEDTVDPQMVVLSGLLEFFSNQFTRPGDRQPEVGVIPAQNVNTLGEVPDSPWFTNRHGRRRMSLDALVAGPGNADPPRRDEPWRVLTVKPYGDRTGLLVADADDTIYLLRFDAKDHLELKTGAELVSSKFYYAAGYDTLENYLVYFERDQLVIGEGAEEITSIGELRELIPEDLDEFLFSVARDERGYRAVATRAPYRRILGNYQLYGTRSDDPNDVVPHEHRRDLRGMWVLHAWLNNNKFNPANTLEVLVQENGVQYVRRLVIDFFKTLGAGERGPKEARDGNEYRFELDAALRNVAGMGVVTPDWATAPNAGLRSVGRFDGEVFDADAWTADTHYVTWANRLPDDLYWGAKLVMSFSDEEIRAIVNTGGYSDAEATRWIADALIRRRDEIGRDFLAEVLPLDNFRVAGGRLEFDDLMVLHGFAEPRSLAVTWHAYDNIADVLTLARADGNDPYALTPDAVSAPTGAYFAVQIDDRQQPGMNVIVYLRKQASGFEVVGIDRNWPGKIAVAPGTSVTVDVTFSRYEDLDERRRALLERPAREYNETTGRNLSVQEWFDTQLTLSERTTFDAITHALMNTELTDAAGNDLGTALDLVQSLERIAGQYSGRGGDQQFRIYVDLVPDAEPMLQRATQFFAGHENTVYHVGYPRSYRQQGSVPNMQVSVSEDGRRADIDVDYRSSSAPQALFNGHLTSSNSDVRAGDNHDRHNGRWAGLVNWWQDVFGNIGLRRASTAELLARSVTELPTPLSPDRPPGAAPAELHDAAQEFLTDWIVRGKVDEAMQFFSRRVIACISLEEGGEAEVLDVEQAVVAMREIMSYALRELPARGNLTEAIDEVVARDADMASRIEEHPFARDFTILQLRNRVAAEYTCSTRRGGDPPAMPGGPDATGTYWGVLFRFKARDDGGGIIGLLWDRQEGSWKIVSYDVIEL